MVKKYLLILILFICTLISSCSLSGKNQGNNNQNQNDIYYKVSFDTNFGSFIDSQKIKEGECVVKPTDPTKENFRFLYWTLNDIEYDFNTPVISNIILVALWEQVGYHVHDYVGTKVVPTCTENGYTEYVCSCGATFKDSYIDELGHDEEKHPAKSATSTQIGWEEYVTCTRCDYTTYKEMSKFEVAELEIYEENGRKYVNFGSYPQTHVSDQELINELNKLTKTNERGYYEYSGYEYIKIYTDVYSIPKDKYGKLPNYSSGVEIKDSTYEWFKAEPIKWRILSNNNGTYYVLSEYILTRQLYYKDTNYRLIDGVDIAPNNYKYSDIREFLNNCFLNSAFTLKQQEFILSTEVDNSASTTFSYVNPYVCENTFDKIYLLSYHDMFNSTYGFSTNADKNATLTDYAKATGCYWSISDQYLDMGYWWLRSPLYNVSYYVSYVRNNGEAYNYGKIVDDSDVGVRPAITIKLNK